MNKEFIRNFKVHPYTKSNFITLVTSPDRIFSSVVPRNPFPLNISISLYSNINLDIYWKQEARFRKINNISFHFRHVLTQYINTVTQYRLYSTRTSIRRLYAAADDIDHFLRLSTCYHCYHLFVETASEPSLRLKQPLANTSQPTPS